MQNKRSYKWIGRILKQFFDKDNTFWQMTGFSDTKPQHKPN